MERDRFLDLVRGASIVMVVLGHWMVTQLGWTGSELTLTSSLGLAPGLWPVTWTFQVIPLFFFVGGFANRHSWEGACRRGDGYVTYLDRRVRRILVPTSVLLLAVAALSAIDNLGSGLGLGTPGGIVLQPLWFLGIYVVAIALTPATLAAHRRWGGWVIVALLAGVGLVDVLRLGVGIGPLAFLNVFLMWLAAHQFGYLYGDGALTRSRTVALTLASATCLVLLVALGPYPARMVGVPGDQLVNMNPPTAALAALAVTQIGITVLIRPWVAPVLERRRVFAVVIAVNLSIMTIYLWHQLVFIAVNRVGLPAGLPNPLPPQPSWWLTRPLWFAISGAVLAVVVVALRRTERLAPSPVSGDDAGRRMAATAVVVLIFLGVLALAACDAMHPLDTHEALGFLQVSSVMGFACVGAALLLLRAVRGGPGDIALATLLGAGALALLAIAYAGGLGSFAEVSVAAGLLSVMAAGLAMTGFAAAVLARVQSRATVG